MENGHCGKFGLTPRLVRLVAGHLLMGGTDYSQYIPAFFYRVDRCAKSDRKAIIYMFNHAFDDESSLASERASHSAVLNHHIILSELWPTPAPDPKAFHDALNGYLMSTEVSANLSSLASRWPRSSADTLDGQFAKYDGPMFTAGWIRPTQSRPWEACVPRSTGPIRR